MPGAAPSIGAAFINPMNFPPMQDAPFWPATYIGGSAPANVLFDQGNMYRFGGPHSGGFNMVFCDGSVHSIIYEVDTRVHLELADRQDGVPIEGASYLGQ